MEGKSQTDDGADVDIIGVCAISSIFVIRKCLCIDIFKKKTIWLIDPLA